jgi:hypothetical protein
MYAVIYDNKVVVGPMNWNRGMFQGALERKGIQYPLSRTAPNNLPLTIDEHAKIMRVEEIRPQMNPLVEFYYGPLWDITEEAAIANYEVHDSPIESMRYNLKQLAAQARYSKEVLGTTVTTIAGLASVTSDVFAVNGATGYLDFNSRSKTFATTKALTANTSGQSAIAVATGTYACTSIHIKYTLFDSGYANLRAGSIIIASNAVNAGTDIVIAETSTQDIGDTSLVDFTATVSAGTIRLIVDTTGFMTNSTLNFQYTLI